MHVNYIPEDINFWLNYYKHSIAIQPQYQIGGELPGYRAYSPYHRGAGLGSFFKSLFRVAMPLFKTVGKQALISGSKIAADVSQGIPLKDSAIAQGRDAAGELLKKAGERIQRGRGLGRRMNKRKKSFKNFQFKRSTVKKLEGTTYKKRKTRKSKSVKSRKFRKTVGLDIFSH
jgi:hypothetical protein